MAKKSNLTIAAQSMTALIPFAQAIDARLRMSMVEELTDEIALLERDEKRLRRSRKRGVEIDRALTAGQIMGLRAAIDRLVALRSDWADGKD